MNNSPLTLSQDIYCPATEKFVPLKVVQTDTETDQETMQRFLDEKKALEDSCIP